MIGFVTGLPRTRTYWFSQYFDGLPGVTAYHEALNGCHTKEEFYRRMEDPAGHVINCDSGLCVTDYQEKWPSAPVVVIRRDVDQVYASLSRFFMKMGQPMPSYWFLKEQEEVVAKTPGLHVAFDEINCHLPRIHEYLGIPFDPDHASNMVEQKLNMPELVVDVESYLLWAEEA